MSTEVRSLGVVIQEDSQKSKISWIVPSIKKFVDGREELFLAADIYRPETLVKGCLAVAYILTIALSASSFLFLYELLDNQNLKVLLEETGIGLLGFYVVLVLFTVLTVLLVSPSLADKILSVYIKSKLSEKAENIDRNMYSMLCMLSGFAKGDVPLTEATRLVAMSDLQGIRQEFAKIHTAVTVYGQDFKDAALKVALTTPSEKLSQFLKGLVSYLERKKNFVEYVEEFILLDNVTKRIELSSYSEKLKNVAMVYATLIVIMGVATVFSIASVLDNTLSSSEPLVYVGLPVSSLMMALVLHKGSPTKGAKRPKGEVGLALSVAIALMAIIPVYAGYFAGVEGVKEYALIAGLLLAAFGVVYLRPAIRRDALIERELNEFLMRLYAASRSGENLASAIKGSGEVEKELESVLAMSLTEPIGGAMLRSAREVKHPFFATMLYVVGAVVHRTKSLSDVLTGLLYEYHRYVEVEKIKKGLVSTVGLFLLFAFVLLAFTMGVVKIQLIPMFQKFVDISAGKIQFDAASTERVLDDTVILIASTIPLGLAAILGDFRKALGYFVVTLMVALAFMNITEVIELLGVIATPT